MSFEILVNQWCGGFRVSGPAYEKYTQKGGQLYIHDDDIRHDPILIQIFKEYGSSFVSGAGAALGLETIDEKYKDYYTINEYDGVESVIVNTDGYEKDKLTIAMRDILQFLDNTKITDTQKVAEIRRVINV